MRQIRGMNIGIAGAAIAGCMGLSTAARGEVIVLDQFGGTNGAAIIGRTPTTDLPGGTYSGIHADFSTAVIDTSTGVALPSAKSGNNTLTYLPVASAGSYTKPTRFVVSQDFRADTLNSGLSLGFLPANPVGAVAANRSGYFAVTVNLTGGNQGNLYYYKTTLTPGAGASTGVSTPIATYDSGTFGAFDPTSYYRLSYNVNSTSGDISNIVLSKGALSKAYDFTTTDFTNARTNLFGFQTGAGGAQTGNIDNFQLARQNFGQLSTVAEGTYRGSVTVNGTPATGSYVIGQTADLGTSAATKIGNISIGGDLAAGSGSSPSYAPVYVLLDINGTAGTNDGLDSANLALVAALTGNGDGQLLGDHIAKIGDNTVLGGLLTKYAYANDYDVILKFDTNPVSTTDYFNYDISGITGVDFLSHVGVVPEPSSIAVIGLGALGILAGRRRRRMS